MSINIEFELRPETSYTLKINGVLYSGFVKKEEWQGMAKLVDADGRAVIVEWPDESWPNIIFSGIWRTEKEKEEAGFKAATVIKISPGLVKIPTGEPSI